LPQDEGPAELVGLNRIAEKYEKDGLYPSAEGTYNRATAVAEKVEADPQNRYGGVIDGEVIRSAGCSRRKALACKRWAN
jgi:hypothetical protein